MSKAKPFTMAFIVAVVLGAVASSSAQAGWLVSGSLLAGSAAISTSSIGHSPTVFKFGPEGNIEIECDPYELSAGKISESDKLLINSLVFRGCSIAPFECTLPNSTISTLPVEGLITLDGSLAFKAEIKAENSNGLFATFQIDGPTCTVEGLANIAGSFLALAPTGQDQRLWQLLNLLVETPDEFGINNTRSTVSGGSLIKLENDKQWSFD